MALEPKLEELVALATCVVHRCVVLGDTVGDADYTGGFVGSACEGAFVASICGIGVCCVDAWGIASDAVCGVGAVGTVECVEERVEAITSEGFNEFFDLI